MVASPPASWLAMLAGWQAIGVITMRFIHRIYAGLFGYFWLPCPICGKYFGGHEDRLGSLMTDSARGRCTCPECADEAERRNKENNYFKSDRIVNEQFSLRIEPGERAVQRFFLGDKDG